MALLRKLCLGNNCQFIQNDRLPFDNTLTSLQNVSVPTNVTVSQNLYTSTIKGLLIGSFYVSFNANATGRRAVTLRREGVSDVIAYSSISASPIGGTAINIPFFTRVDVGEVISGQFLQTSGSNLVISQISLNMLIIPDEPVEHI